MSSIYADSSNVYWKNRQRKQSKLLTCIAIGGFALIAICGVVYNRNAHNDLSQRRSLGQTNESHWIECEARVNSRKECTDICQLERNSIQRKTMHQSCIHGCQQAHVASAALGCRGKADSKGRNRKHVTEEDVFKDVGVLAHEHCSKFQSVDPKPDAFATCRKYHRAGTKQGYRSGIEAMSAVLDEEWEAIKSERLANIDD